MASIKEMTTKAGKKFFKIQVSNPRLKSPASMRWYWPEGWSRKSAEKEAARQAALFQEQVDNGEWCTRAEQKEREEQKRIEEQEIKTFQQYSELWLSVKKPVLAKSTCDKYQIVLRLHILPEIGSLKMTEISTARLKKFISDFQAKDYSHSMVCAVHIVLHSIFESAFIDDIININPMSKIKRPEKRKDEASKGDDDMFLTEEQLCQLLKYIELTPLKWNVMINLMADTGARRGEIAGLRWCDIDFEKGYVNFAQNLQYASDKGIYVTTLKNRKSRKVDIPSEIVSMLKELRRHSIDSGHFSISGYVFTIKDSDLPIHPSVITRKIVDIGKKAGIDGFHPHMLRHTFASISLKNGADIVAVSKKLGHSSPSITLSVYSHSTEEAIKSAGDSFREAIKARKEI